MNKLPTNEIVNVSPVATGDSKRKVVRDSNDESGSTNAKNPQQDSSCNNGCKVEGMDKTNSNNAITTLGPYDVISGRTAKTFNNIGNKRFRVLMNMNLKRYVAEKSKTDKTEFIAALSKELTHEVGMRFLKEVQQKGMETTNKKTKGPNSRRFNKKKTGDTTQSHAVVQYVELNKKEIHSKVGHALRDLAFHAAALEENENDGNKNNSQRTTSPMPSLIERFGMLRSYEQTNAASPGFSSSNQVYPRPEFHPSFDGQRSYGSSTSSSSIGCTNNQPSIKIVGASRDEDVPDHVSSNSDFINRKIWEEGSTSSINETKRLSVSSVNSDAAFHECMNDLASLLFPSTTPAI